MAKKIELQTAKQVVPMIYAYTTPEIERHHGWTKIGYTEQDVDERIAQQTRTADVAYHEEWRGTAIYDDGSGKAFRDTDFHAYLRKEGVEQDKEKNNEWFHITGPASKEKFYEFKSNRGVSPTPESVPYVLRNEQEDAVERAKAYFESRKYGEYLWNAKPRFGKTLAVYDLCLRMEAQRILIVTNRPAIANSWYDDFVKFVGSEKGYLFVSDTDALKDKPHVLSRKQFEELLANPALCAKSDYENKLKGHIAFMSLQDLKGSLYFGGEYDKLKYVRDITWDILVIDEAHEGVDTEKTDVAFDQIKRQYTLHLSGTPFKALANNKFPSDAIYNWTYADEQRAKREWTPVPGTQNPYAELPQLRMFTYQMSEMIREEVKRGIEIDGETEEYAFDLNEFFAVREKGGFAHNESVDQFLDALTTQEKYPFSTEELRAELKHTLWLLNRVDSAKALANKLKKHPVFSEYEIVLAAGDGKLDEDSETVNSYNKVRKAIEKYEKTITLSVGQLTTGVTVPEWSAVLMLSNVKSPALYMQAAFRAQNPCLFHEGKELRRKQNAYVFDFDPARTLIIYEQFANDLNAETTGGRGDSEARKKNIYELLNFFPVVGEDSEGEMVELDAEQILSIPRRIKAVEVVRRGFMSNFLFQNISAVFGAPQVVRDIIENIEAAKDDKIKAKVEGLVDGAKEELGIVDGEVHVPPELIIGTEQDVFGDKITRPVEEIAADIFEDFNDEKPKSGGQDKIDKLRQDMHNAIKEVVDEHVEVGEKAFGKDFTQKGQNAVISEVTGSAIKEFDKAVAEYRIENNVIEHEREKELEEAQTEKEKREINRKYDQRKKKEEEKLEKKAGEALENAAEKSKKAVVERVETDIRVAKKNAIEEGVRDHLRGFSRTIPSFLMAYGSDAEISLDNFDQIVPDAVFKEVTGITLDDFRFLRDGGDFQDPQTGQQGYFQGRLFDEVVFNDSVKQFLSLKKKLADYFDEEQTEDIFDYIPPQKTNQIFTPKKVVVQMVDLLEKENPGCFDDPDKTFADLYMKSGLYITEIVKRLYRSKKLKTLFPDDGERLRHIFARQVYGLAPTEIIYRITLAFILGFKDDLKIGKYNIKLCDALQYAKEGTLEEKLAELFPERTTD